MARTTDPEKKKESAEECAERLRALQAASENPAKLNSQVAALPMS